MRGLSIGKVIEWAIYGAVMMGTVAFGVFYLACFVLGVK